MIGVRITRQTIWLFAVLISFMVAFHANAASAAVVINDDEYIYYGQWKHATNDTGGYEASSTPILWRKKAEPGAIVYMSVYLVDRKTWNASGTVPVGGWHDTSLYQWLDGASSGSFYADAFTPSEKQGMKLDPFGDTGAWVTMPDVYTGLGLSSRFGRAGYRQEKTGQDINQAYWLRRGYDHSVPSTTEAWAVSSTNTEGPDVVTALHGIRPLISLNLDAFLFKTGSGTMAAPYVLYGGGEQMRPQELSVNGGTLSVKFGLNIAGFGGVLPSVGDFGLTQSDLSKRQRDAAIAGIRVSPTDPTTLLLTLSEPVTYRDGLQLSYNLPVDATGVLTGGALIAQSENAAMPPFDHLSVRNETPPTVADIRITPADTVQTPAYRPFLTEFTVSNAKQGGTIVLNGASQQAPVTGLATTFNAAARTVTISGTPEAEGSYIVNLDATLDGTRIRDGKITVNLLPSNSLADILLTPTPTDPIVLRQDTNVTYTVTSTVLPPRSVVRLTSVTEGAGWSATGLRVTPDTANNRFTLTGVPVRAGDYMLTVAATIDGQPKTKDLQVEILYPNTNPQPGDIRVTVDNSGPFQINSPLRFTYTVGSSIPGAEVILADVRTGGEWSDSGLSIQPNLAAKTITVFGTPSAAGNYSVTMDVRIDGVLLTGHMEYFVVGNPPTAGDIVFVPAIPRAKAFRPYKVETHVASSTGEPLTLHDVTASVGWQNSGLRFGFDAAKRTVTVEGLPTKVGTYTLRLDVSIGGTRITNGALVVRVDPSGGNPTIDNIMIVPTPADVLTVGTPADVRYLVKTGIEDAALTLSNIRGGDNWAAGGLRFVGDPANATFHVFGIPAVAGTYHLLMDVEIDGTLIRDYAANILVVRAPATATDVVFTPPLPAAKANRQYQAETILSSRTNDALILNSVTSGDAWSSSGLTFEVDRPNRSVRVSGTPIRVGTFTLNVDATIGGTRVTGEILMVRVEPGDSNPTSADLMVVPSTTENFKVGRQAAVTYTATSGILDANVVVQRIRPGADWASSGLRFGAIRRTTTFAGATSASFSVYGTPAKAGTYILYLDAVIDGVLIGGYELRIVVQEAPITAEDLVFDPRIPNAKAHRPYVATTTVGSRTGEAVVLNNVTGGINWENSGMTFRYETAEGTITVLGTPTQEGDYMLDVNATIGGTSIPNGALVVRVDTAGTNPTAANLTVSAAPTGPLIVDETTNVRYTLSTGIRDANIRLVDLRGGPGWEESGLEFNYAAISSTDRGAASETFTVFGVPAVAGIYTLYASVEVDGVTIANYPIQLLVLDASIAVDDLTFTPRIPSAKAQRPFEATTTVGSRRGASVVLNGVSDGPDWARSGLVHSFDAASRTITISGTPASAGDYSLYVDVTIGGVRLPDAELTVRVDERDTPPTADNIVIIPSHLYNFVIDRYTSITYQVRTGILDAKVQLLNVRSSAGWEESGLQYDYDEETRTFTVSGTPTILGTFTLLMDIRVDDTLIADYRVAIQVVALDPEDHNGSRGGGCSAAPFALVALLPALGLVTGFRRRR